MRIKLAAWVLVGLCSAAPVMANDWFQWRGPEQDGVSREKNLPEKWTPEGENLAWSAPVGGMSCPIVMNGYLYSFTRVGEVAAGVGNGATVDPGPKTQEALTCVDVKTGKIVWQYLQNMFQTDAPFHRLGWSSPVGNPETGNVYAMGTQTTLVCLEGKTGKVIWSHQMTEEFGMISTFGGRTASPAIDEDQLFITGVSFGWGDNAGSQHRIFAMDKKTGKLNWTAGTTGVPVDAPYNTPVIGVVGGQRIVVFPAGDGGIHAFQAPHTGKKLFTYKASKHGMNSSCLIKGDLVYGTWDLDNFASNKLGGVVCLDGSKVKNGEPEVVWRKEGIEDGFPTVTLADNTLYALTDNAQLFAFDAKTGKEKFHKGGLGTIGKASLVYGDGKLYIAEANGRFSIVKPEATKITFLSKTEFNDKPGREYVIFGSPAISDGHVFLATATTLYCIGPKEFSKQEAAIPEPVKESAEKGEPAVIQVVPADVVTHPGEKVKLTAHAFDAMGKPLGEAKVEKWEVGQVTIPAPPPRPGALNRPNPAAAAAQGEAGAAQPPVAAPVPPPPPAPPAPTGPTKAGNLEGTVDASGTFTAAEDPTHVVEGGAVFAHVGKLEGFARVRSFPSLPWKADFEKAIVGKPPLTWIGAGMKFAVRPDPNDPNNKVLTKLTDIPLFARARTYMGTDDMTNYTVQADTRATEVVFNDNGSEVHKMPDMGVINSRYCLELKGSNQTVSLYGWGAAIPRNELAPGLATHAAKRFAWKAGVWYTQKIMVQQQDGKAIVKGKVWQKGQPEPEAWTIEMEDPTPNTHGTAGLWGFSNDLEIYYDNIIVTANK